MPENVDKGNLQFYLLSMRRRLHVENSAYLELSVILFDACEKSLYFESLKEGNLFFMGL